MTELQPGELLVRATIEMIGAPKEHIEETLKNFISSLKDEEKPFKLLKEDFASAEKQGKYFSAFVEVETLCNNIQAFFAFCLEAMPSSIEIIEPLDMTLNTHELSHLMNDVQAKMHDVDMLVKGVRAQNKVLDDNATAVFKNFVHHLVSSGEKSIEELCKPMGVTPKMLEPFLDKMVASDALVKVGDKFSLKK